MPPQADLSAARREADAVNAQLAAARAAANSSAGGFQAQLDAAAAAAERDAASIAGLEARLEDTQRRLVAEQARSAEQVRMEWCIQSDDCENILWAGLSWLERR
jgi:hypothetical protein